MCPCSNSRKREAKRWPKYRNAFEKAFIRLYKNKKQEAKEKKKDSSSVDSWKDGKEMFRWWLMSRPPKRVPDQMVLFE